MKRVVSFSLWGNDRGMWRGAVENAKLALQYYPGWEVWLHLPRSPNIGVDARSACLWELFEVENTSLRYVDAPETWAGLFWRFAPVFDPSVEFTLIRDCDSRLNPREAAAVREWIRPAGFDMETMHHMRDHIEHTTVPIMGGMCGFTHWPRMRDLLSEWSDRNHKGADQEFLAQRVWPELRGYAMCHDRWPEGVIRDADGGLHPPQAPIVGYHYDPVTFFGEHRRLPFPAHEPLCPETHGEFVGARVGL